MSGDFEIEQYGKTISVRRYNDDSLILAIEDGTRASMAFGKASELLEPLAAGLGYTVTKTADLPDLTPSGAEAIIDWHVDGSLERARDLIATLTAAVNVVEAQPKIDPEDLDAIEGIILETDDDLTGTQVDRIARALLASGKVEVKKDA